MNLIWRSQRRFLARSPWSAATALAGMALGVASVVAVHLISVQVQQALAAAEPPHLAGLTHVLEREGLDSAAYFGLRDWWRQHPEVAIEGLLPVVEGHAVLDGRRVQIVGADWLAAPQGPQPEAAAPAAVDTAVLLGDALLADPALGLAAGERIILASRAFTIADLRAAGPGPGLIGDIAAAHFILGQPPQTLSRVGLRLHDPWAPWRERLDRLMPGFGAGLPAPQPGDLAALLGAAPDVPGGWRATPVAAELPTTAFARSVLFNLGALGTLALLVAWFLIYQVGVIWLRRQQGVLERLHQVGAPVAGLRRSFLGLFAGLGAAATVLGGLLGVVLASVLGAMATQALDVSVGERLAQALDPWLLVKALVSGLGVCLLGGVAAFAREQRRELPPWRWWLPLPLLLAVLAVGVGVPATGVLGGFAAILALSLVGVALVTPILQLLRRGAQWRRGRLLDRLALREVVWYPRVLNVALAALALAVATGIGVGLMVESFRLDFTRMLSVRLAGDLYAYGPDPVVGQAAAWLAARDEVSGLRRFGELDARVAGRPVELGFARFDAAESARYGHPRALQPGEALISEGLARALRVGPGGRLPAGGGSLEVAGTFPGFGESRGRVLVDVATLAALGETPRFNRLSVDSAVPARLAAALTERFPELRVESRSAIRRQSLDIFDRTFAITQALTVLALIVATVGTYNALTALRLQQLASTRLLLAQGVLASELRRIGAIRALSVGAAAVLLAAPLGVAMAWILCAVVNPRSFGWTIELHLLPGGWLPPLLLGMGAALLAGLLPAPQEGGDLGEAA